MAEKIQHLVDIIVPSFNRKSFLDRAVSSVYNQSYKNWNLIIVDDGSTDGTCNGDYGDKAKLLRLNKNKGVSFARNHGIRNSQADWIAFLDSDDEWKARKLEKQIQLTVEKPQAVLVHCNEVWLRNGKILNQKKKHKKRAGKIFSCCVLLCCISPSSVLIKREVFYELGFFREDFPVCEDYEFWLRLSSRREVFFLNEALVIKHGGHSDQLSKKFIAMDYWRVKALLPFLQDHHLSLTEKEEVKKSLLKRSEILLKGYEKHKNFKNRQEIQKIYNKLLTY